MAQRASIPPFFCWTRFGTEAGQPINEIFARKEAERAAGAGVFLWGIGNAIGNGVGRLLEASDRPEVLFSPINSAPRKADSDPAAVVGWSGATGLDGLSFPIPQHALVTSRFDPAAPRRYHYALVCHCETPLQQSEELGEVNVEAVRNLASGRPVGASQVTAIVRYDVENSDSSARTYKVYVRAGLVYPYLIRLHDPVPIYSRALPPGNSLDVESTGLMSERSLIPAVQRRLDLLTNTPFRTY